MTYLVTGCAGFIGFHVSRELIRRGERVVGIDSVNSYYEPALKEERLALLNETAASQSSGGSFSFFCGQIEDKALVERVFASENVDRVIHLAAQAGVRYSLEAPESYISANIAGFLNILEACRARKTAHLVYASSSSVYGMNRKTPFSEKDAADHPVSIYGATKRAGELMAHAYSSLFDLPATGLRFFTVYGPWGRPDMAYFKFAKAIMNGDAIDVYNGGVLSRDFTYIDDVVKAVLLVAERPAEPDKDFDPLAPSPDASTAPFRVYNIGNSQPEPLERLITLLEENLGKVAVRRSLPMQPGDLYATAADTHCLERDFGWKPHTSLDEGIKAFCEWFLEYYSRREQLED